MNADEAAKCLLVARRLLAQAQRGEGDVHACLERALKYAEKSKRLDASLTSASDDLASALRRARRDPTFVRGSQGARASGSGDRGGGSGGGGGGARARASPSKPAAPPPNVKGTPDQEALMARVRRSDDYYSILGIAKGCSDAEIKKAYRKTAMKLHPDKCQATGADECFKRVGRAYACLSDEDKRAAYDRYGTEDPGGMRGGGGGGGGGGGPGRSYGHGGGHAYRGFAHDDIDPAEIFNMFFGNGGSPFGNARYRSAYGNGGFARPTHRGDRRRAERSRAGGGGADDAAETFRNLFQLLPILLVFLMYLLSPAQESHFAMNRTHAYSKPRTTSRLEVPFYVKPTGEFERKYRTRRELERAEHSIEMSHMNSLETNCMLERSQQQRMYKFGMKSDRERAKTMELKSCDKLRSLRAKLSSSGRDGDRGRGSF